MRTIFLPFGALGRNEVLANHIAKNLVHEFRFLELVNRLGEVARQVFQTAFGDFSLRKLEQVFFDRRAQIETFLDALEARSKHGSVRQIRIRRRIDAAHRNARR